MLLLATPAPPAPDTFAIQVVLSIAILAALAVLVLFNACRRARGTTLFAPLAWGLASFVLIVLAGINLRPGLPGNSLNTRTTWWLLVATSSCCPTVALLGAKRPQNRAWQLIVLSLWGILALPAVQNLVLHPSDPPSVHLIWRWFYVVLIFVGAFNYQATPFAIAGITAAIGQAMMLIQFLPGMPTDMEEGPTIGIFVVAASILLSWATRVLRRGRMSRFGNELGWNRVWTDFRDGYGLIWSIRVIERIESLLQSSAAPVWIKWDGFLPRERMKTADLREPLASVDAGLRNLFRRFVSTEWIDSRLGIISESTNSTARTATENTVE